MCEAPPGEGRRALRDKDLFAKIPGLWEDNIALDDADLVRRMAARDASALEAFYNRHNRIAFTLVLRIVKVREDAEDVLTDVFWQAWQQASRYDMSRGTPLAWLLTIARTRAIDCLRSAGRRGTETSFEVETVPVPGEQSDPFVVAGVKRAVAKCLEALPEAQRTVLELAYFEGMSHSEIASMLNQPPDAIKNRIRTGMMYLRNCLKLHEAAL